MRAALPALLLLTVVGCARAPVTPDRPATSQGATARRERPERDRRERTAERPPRDETDSASPMAEGLISFYGERFHGRLTANGERFNRHAMTAAHRKLPFGTCLIVENVSNGRRVKVRVNDRGPYAGKRILDVSEGAAARLGMIDQGVTRARLWRCPDAR